MCKCKVVVLLIKPIAFLQFSLPSPSSLLKLPVVNDFLTGAWAKLLRTMKLRKSKMGRLFQTLICSLTSLDGNEL